MSVSRMKKLTLFAWRDESDSLIRRLVRLRCVDVSVSESFSEEKFCMVRLNCDADRAALEGSISNIDDAMLALNKYSQKKRSLLTPRARIDSEEFVANGSAEKARDAVRKTVAYTDRQNEIKNEISRLYTLIYAAEPYEALDVPLGFVGTERTEMLLGALPASADIDAVGKELYLAGAIAELLRVDNVGKYISVFCL